MFNGYSFTQTLTGRLGDDLWNTGGSFKNLPGWIVKAGTGDTAADNTATKLEYRVVESYITVSGTGYEQVIKVINSENGETYTYNFADGLFSAYYGEGKDSHDSEDNIQYKQVGNHRPYDHEGVGRRQGQPLRGPGRRPERILSMTGRSVS